MNKLICWTKEKKTILVLVVIVSFGFILRVYSLGDEAMWIDETISSLSSRNIIEKGLPIFDSGAFYFRALTFHYLGALFMLIFNDNFGAFGVRFVSVLFGLATIILAYFIGKEYNKETGIISAILTAVFFLEIVYSRQARFYQMFQFLFFLTIYLLYKSKYDKKYSYAAGIVFLILVDTHLAGIILLPFFLYVYYKQKDWKIIILPLIVTLIYFPQILNIVYGDEAIASANLERYSYQLFYKLRAFMIISAIGIPFAYRINKRLSLSLILPSVALFLALILIKVSAIRYAYFVIFISLIFMSVLLSYIHNKNKIFFYIAIAFVLIYPSNIVFENNYLTVLYPQNIERGSSSEPVIDYINLSEDTKNIIINSKIVALWTPGVSLHYKNPDYFIPFSLNGLESGYALYNGRDIYTWAEAFDNQINEFVLIEDNFGYSKLNKEERMNIEKIKLDCIEIDENPSLKIYNCKT